MTDEYVLAIDVGTGSARAVLFTASGHQAGFGQREYSHRTLPDVPGSQVFDTAENWWLIGQCVQEAMAGAGVRAGAVRAVSATSMREGMVLYDGDGQEIWACPNVDSRATAEAVELIASGEAQEIYERAGDWVAITDPARFRWIARHEPKTFAAIAHVGMIGDWVLAKLSGEFVTDPSLGSSSGMFDLARRDWSDRILDICELERKIFPPVLEPGTVIGGVTAEAAQETGLAEGTPWSWSVGPILSLDFWASVSPLPGRFTIVGRDFLATHDAAGPSFGRPRSAVAYVVPRVAGAMDDGGHRVLLRAGDALVP